MNSESEIIQQILLSEGSITLKSDGIVYVYINRFTEVNLDLRKKLQQHYFEITNGKLTPFLFEGGDGITVTKEAQDFAAQNLNESPYLGFAIIVDNIAKRMIANFYLELSKPKKPNKLFTNRVDAIEWLKQLN